MAKLADLRKIPERPQPRAHRLSAYILFPRPGQRWRQQRPPLTRRRAVYPARLFKSKRSTVGASSLWLAFERKDTCFINKDQIIGNPRR